MLDCNAVVTPVESGKNLKEFDDEEKVDATSYKHMLGSFMYLYNNRPNINFIIGLLSKFMHDPKKSHLLA